MTTRQRAGAGSSKPGNAIAPSGGIVVQPEAERGFSEHVRDVVLGCCAWK